MQEEKTLQEWFYERNKAAFARRIGVHANTLSAYIKFKMKPPLPTRIAIESETNGEVHRERGWPNGERKHD